MTLDDVLAAAVDTGQAFGVVAVAANADGPLYSGAAGRRRADGDEAMTTDSMFRIASMTKPITSVAVMQLIESGAVDLDAPVGDLVPSFDDLAVLDGFDGETPRLRPAKARATVRQLLSHTSGLSYWIWNADTTRYEELTGQLNVLSGTNSAFANPLVRDPGTRWEYSMATDWAGRVIEAAAGQGLDRYLRDNVFEPLGMTDITVKMSDEQRARSVPVHAHTPDGFVPTDLDWNQEPEFWAGGHCLYSTAEDYLRFCRMLLGRGQVDGVRILRPETVEAMLTNQLGDLRLESLPEVHADLTCQVDFPPGDTWGLGFQLTGSHQPGMRANGSGSWAGLFNTYFWVDPASGVTGAIFLQHLPFFDPAALDVLDHFERAVYA